MARCLPLLMAWLWLLPVQAEQLTLALMPTSGQQREAYYDLARSFQQQHPGIELHLRTFPHEAYKADIAQLLRNLEPSPDVFFWFAGAKLKQLAEAGLVLELGDLWQRQSWHQAFASTQEGVSHDGGVYGLPLFYYHWGFYYSRSLFQAHGLQPPRDWPGLLKLCTQLRSAGVTPFALGSAEAWPLAGWFDYITLRLHGIRFYRRLIAGQVPMTDPRVRATFSHWQQLMDHDCFLHQHAELGWQGALPFLFRQKAAATLMGNFFVATVPASVKPDLGFFPFPQINPDLPRYEQAPTDILMVSSATPNRAAAEAFLAFMGQADTQTHLAALLEQLPPHQQATVANDRFAEAGDDLLRNAAGVIQFFDRDAKPFIFQPGLAAMQQFMAAPEQIDAILMKLEQQRQHGMAEVDVAPSLQSPR